MKIFKMGSLSFLNKMFAFYFVFDAFQGCLQNYAMLPLFHERYRKTKDRNIEKLESKSKPKLLVSNLKYAYGSTILLFLFSDQMKNVFLEANFKTLGAETTFEYWILMYCIEEFGKLKHKIIAKAQAPSP